MRSILQGLKTEGVSVFDRFTGKLDGTIWYYTSLAQIFESMYPSEIAKAYKDGVDQLKVLTKNLIEEKG